jgi:hypothetical protein
MCAPEVSGHAMELETGYGVPSVAVHADAFARLVDSVVRVNGMPRARRAYVPTPVLDRAPAELRLYIEGDDPVRGRPFMVEVMEALTRPLDPEDLRGVEFDRSAPRLVDPDTEESLHRLFRENRWTDYLPIVLPTEERVEAMLAGTSHSPDEVVGQMRPTGYRELWEFTVEKVAVNAVMAGADPAYFPVILALAASGFTARQSSTSSMANMVVVNGPIRNEIGMNSGLGALGPYNHANATIGRAYGLLSQNLQGGSVPGETYMGAQGNAYAYTSLTFAENEERSPWEPYHVQHGFGADESTASIFYCWGNVWTEGLRETWEEKVKAMLSGQDSYLGAILVMDPIVAREFVERGFDTKGKLIDWVHENVRITARRYWDNFTTRNLMHDIAEAGVEPWAGYWNAPPDELVPVFEPDLVNVFVAGGSTNGQWSSFNGRPLDPRFRNAPTDPHVVSIDVWR